MTAQPNIPSAPVPGDLSQPAVEDSSGASVVDNRDHPRWGRLDPLAREEIDVFETELRRVQAGQMSERVFLEFRLRHGVYGQRQQGVQMQRIKIPLGRMTFEQMEVMADLSEEYAVGISHVTTRQDIQMHYIHIDDTPDLMRRLAEVGVTTREACGNVVRNVCACPRSGCCPGERFDVTPYAQAMAEFLLRHPDGQNFGRKFKIAYSGCAEEQCGLALMHDIGAVAQVREVDGAVERGFRVFVGGGLGAVPHRAKLYADFLPAEEMLPLAQAISRVFARLGEKRNRARARMKFLVAKLGIDEFRRLVDAERAALKADPRWREHLASAADFGEEPVRPPSVLDLAGTSAAFRRWVASNVRPQRQAGYSMATVFLPLGDITAEQLRGLARLCRGLVPGPVVATVEQNLLVRWIGGGDLPVFYRGLQALQLDGRGAARLKDVTACPGTDSCKLGISSSRGLASVLHEKFDNGMSGLALRDDIRVKISGCFNACGQHHVGDIGFFGSVKRKGRSTAPVFQVVLGGTARGNAESFGLPVARVAAREAPRVIRRLTDLYDAEKADGESFRDFASRVGKKRLKAALAELERIPSYDESPEYYRDNRQDWDYHLSTGVGECAGEVVDQAEFLLEEADRLQFEGSVRLEEGRHREAAELSFKAMLQAAHGLLSTKGLLLSDGYDPVDEFRRHFGDNGFYRPFTEYFYRAARQGAAGLDEELAHQRVEESRLFLEEAERVYSQMA